MKIVRSRWLLLILLPVLMAIGGGAAVHGQSASRYFPETGKTVSGRFLEYWNNHGGLAQQGYPISNLLQETSETDGRVYTVQYFERAVFESHPENVAPYDVLLSLLGTFRYKEKYPSGADNQEPNNSPGSRFFPETGKRLGGLFLTYWQEHGQLEQQGYPISDEFLERSDLNGVVYRVQYFERAVFEYHPENSEPYNVLLSQLGTFRYKQLYMPTSTPVPATNTAVPATNTPVPGRPRNTRIRATNTRAIPTPVRTAPVPATNTLAPLPTPIDTFVAVLRR